MRPRSPSEMLEPTRAPSRQYMAPSSGSQRRGPVGGLVRVGSALLTVLLVVMVGIAALAGLLYHQYERPGPLDVARVIAIPKGEGRIAIASRLEREGVISNRWTFIASYLLQNSFGRKTGDMQAGEYEFKQRASMSDVMDMLTQGRAILAKLTIPEGLTSLQIVERVRAELDLVGDVTQIPPEGSLLPDTYRFSRGIDRQELINRMQAEMKRFLAAAWDKRQPDIPIKSPEEAVIFASIVEKETGRADERDRVAGVFANRMRKGMRLQSDPTVIYGIAGGKGPLGRSLTRSDLSGETAHNTYQIDGLPPTPICNPGRSAIEATLNPASTKDLFFVADGTGGHAFSETLKDHNSAVAKWRKIEKELRAKRKAAEVAPLPTDLPVASSDAARAAAGASGASSPQVINAGAAAASENVPIPVRKPIQR
jgi:peptidoglycan lytic transglycosylase G